MPIDIVTKNIKKVQINKRSEDYWIQGIVENNSSILTEIYNENFEKIKVMVLNFKNLKIAPTDVFQEGLTRAVINIRENKFKKQSKFSTYLYGICHNICLKNYKESSQELSANSYKDTDDNDDNQYYELLQYVLTVKHQLDKKCREIIDLRFNLNRDQKSTRFDEIAKRLSLSADNARQRFRRCMNKLSNLIFSNPQFKSLFI